MVRNHEQSIVYFPSRVVLLHLSLRLADTQKLGWRAGRVDWHQRKLWKQSECRSASPRSKLE